MEDQEIRELAKDLESVGLSSNEGILTVGEEGIVEIVRELSNWDLKIGEFPLIKKMDLDFYRRDETLVFQRQGNSSSPAYYKIKFKTKELAKTALIRISAYLNS